MMRTGRQKSLGERAGGPRSVASPPGPEYGSVCWAGVVPFLTVELSGAKPLALPEPGTKPGGRAAEPRDDDARLAALLRGLRKT
jgi:hypothetical protein